MSLQRAPSAPRFVRRTSLGPGEYRKNFRQIDREIIEAVTSAESDAVTPLMGKIYLRLVNAPEGCWERDGVLRFESELRGAGQVKAWSVLCEVLGVASATANKALRWMHGQGIIGYFAGKNGVGIRIFLNRASSSVGKKILPFPPASSGARRASPDETAFMDSFADPEGLDPDLNPRAPKNGAETKPVGTKVFTPISPHNHQPGAASFREGREVEAFHEYPGAVSADEIVARLRSELEPCVKTAAAQAAAQAAAREVARTREWFETKALPKAVRVAQHETYGLLRRHGTMDGRARRDRAGLDVGRVGAAASVTTPAHKLTPEEIVQVAETCVALLETQGKSVDVTLSEINAEGGGWLLPEDAPRVREAAQALLGERDERSGALEGYRARLPDSVKPET